MTHEHDDEEPAINSEVIWNFSIFHSNYFMSELDKNVCLSLKKSFVLAFECILGFILKVL